MKWEDEGFVISKKKFRENAVILEIFTSYPYPKSQAKCLISFRI